MSESMDGRLNRVEQELARVAQEQARQGQRMEDEVRISRDLANIVKRIPEDMATMRERLGLAIKRSNDCLHKHEELEDFLHQRDREQARERKSDRRWLVGTGLSSAGLVIASLALLADKL